MGTALTLALGLATFTYQMGLDINAARREEAEQRLEQAEARAREAESERDDALRRLQEQEAAPEAPTDSNPVRAPATSEPPTPTSVPSGIAITGDAAPQVSVIAGESVSEFGGAVRVGLRQTYGVTAEINLTTAAAECMGSFYVGQSVALAGSNNLWYRVTIIRVVHEVEQAVDLLLEQYAAQPPASETCGGAPQS